ncbi:hypothetical protein EJ06DRAFT_529462, partial [Trichodelitschia bisporula]
MKASHHKADGPQPEPPQGPQESRKSSIQRRPQTSPHDTRSPNPIPSSGSTPSPNPAANPPRYPLPSHKYNILGQHT